jgi:Capsule assembly protein Wzi
VVVRSLTLLPMCLMLTKVFHAANPSDPQDAQQRSASNMASTYVPIESWVYPASERLAAEGYLQSAFFDLRPWTRMDCARLVEEAEDNINNDPTTSDGPTLLRSLKEEFNLELRRRTGGRNAEFRLESLDQRVTAIAGRPLTDGYHFAETLVDDEGRPFAEGANLYSEVSFRATAGRFAAYVKTELQRVPPAPVPGLQAQQAIALADFTPVGAKGPHSGFTRGRLLDANVSFAFFDNQFTFGRQPLWWDPARSGSTLFGNNAEPITMLRYDRVRPFELPGFLKLLGPTRVELLIGRLAGAQYVHAQHITFGTPGVPVDDQPFIHGEKFSFKPTPNFEFGVSRTVLWSGKGAPANVSTFLRSVFSTGTGDEGNDPGDRRSAFDAQYRIPGLRQCLTEYVDGFTEDEPFPVNYPTQSTWISGFALRCVPHADHLTIRAEDLLSPHHDMAFPGYFYFNVYNLSGYTNNRQLIGSWIGREGNGEQLWATWQRSPRSSVALSGRNMTAASEFLRGGTLRDLRVAADLAIHPEWQLSLEEQTEWWRFPLLSSEPQHNAEFTIQLSYRPIARMKS